MSAGEQPHTSEDRPAGRPRPPLGDDIPRRLRWALRAYPRDVRATEGDTLISLARDILDEGGSSIDREALGLLRGGLAARAGALARAPWEPALRRAALGIAGAVLALACGAASWWLRDPAWPGWRWIAVLTAPVLVIGGLVAGRRAPVAGGALLLLVLGVAQANGFRPTFALQGSIEWGVRGGPNAGAAASFDLPLLACALPGALVILASAAHARRPVPRAAAAATVAWLAAAAAGAFLAVEGIATRNPPSALTLGGIRLDGLGACMAAAVVAAMISLALGLARRRRDPAGMLAGALVVAAVLPVVVLYGLAALPLGDGQGHVALLMASVAIAAGFVAIVRRIAPEPSRAR